jgi:hypothetical protein
MQAVVKTLTKLGVDLEQPSKANVTPIDMARVSADGASDDPVLSFMIRSAEVLARQKESMASRKESKRQAA